MKCKQNTENQHFIGNRINKFAEIGNRVVFPCDFSIEKIGQHGCGIQQTGRQYPYRCRNLADKRIFKQKEQDKGNQTNAD